jgi:hypothetical protein
MTTLTVTVKQEIPLKRIQDLLCCAFEGGSNYWYTIVEFVKPAELKVRTEEGEIFRHLDYPVNEGGAEIYRHLDYPVNEGGAVVVGDREEWYPYRMEKERAEHLKESFDKPEPKKYRLDLEAIDRGLQLMADKYPRHFADFVGENEDASTGDVFLQLCLFGELVYG